MALEDEATFNELGESCSPKIGEWVGRENTPFVGDLTVVRRLRADGEVDIGRLSRVLVEPEKREESDWKNEGMLLLSCVKGS